MVIAREYAAEFHKKSLVRMEDAAREIEEEVSKGKLTLDFFNDLLDKLGLPEK